MSHISFSELKQWVECPWKHKLNYIDEINRFKGNVHTAFGTSLHTVCESLTLNDNKEGFDWSTYNAHDHFEEEFVKNLKELKNTSPDAALDPKLINDMRAQGKHLTQFILPGLKKTFGKFKLISVEEKLYEDIKKGPSSKKFKGFIDLVIFTPSDDKYHIIDWKTCSWGWDNRRKTDKMVTYQLTLYKHFWCQRHDKSYNEVVTHFALLKRTAKKNNVEIFKVSNGAKKIENALKLLGKAVYNIENNNFLKNRLSCYGKFGICEYYKSNHCS